MANENKGNVLAIGVCFALFFMIAFVTNFAGAMGPILKNQFGASNMASQLGSAANFFAYFFMGIPGGLILKRIRCTKACIRVSRRLRNNGDDGLVLLCQLLQCLQNLCMCTEGPAYRESDPLLSHTRSPRSSRI